MRSSLIALLYASARFVSIPSSSGGVLHRGNTIDALAREVHSVSIPSSSGGVLHVAGSRESELGVRIPSQSLLHQGVCFMVLLNDIFKRKG